MEIVDVLKMARAFVEHGWCQRTLQDAQQRVCAVGALNKACWGQVHRFWSESIEERDAILSVLNKYVPYDFDGQVVHFNDDPNTTKQDVLDLFDKAIADLGGMA